MLPNKIALGQKDASRLINSPIGQEDNSRRTPLQMGVLVLRGFKYVVLGIVTFSLFVGKNDFVLE
jgi:hypothetical protein